MDRLRTGEIGLTAVEVVVASFVVLALFGIGTWVLSERQRRDLTNLAINNPAQVFVLDCAYLADVDRFRSIRCIVTNTTNRTLPFRFRANSFLGQRAGVSYDGLPVTGRPPGSSFENNDYWSVPIAPRKSISFDLFSEYPVKDGEFLVAIVPVRQSTPKVVRMIPASPGAKGFTSELMPAPGIRNLYTGTDWLTTTIDTKDPTE